MICAHCGARNKKDAKFCGSCGRGMNDRASFEAFISYAHNKRDEQVAAAIQKALEGFRIPAGVKIERNIKRLGKLFRDKDELSSSTSLNSQIVDALENSRFLIVICSEEAAASKWVNAEVEAFIEAHGRQNVIAVLSHGEPVQAYPNAIADFCAEDDLPDIYGHNELLAVDMRGSKLRGKIFKLELLRLVASILGCGYDELVCRQRARSKKRIVTVVACAVIIVLAFCLLGARLLSSIHKSQAQEAARLVESSVNMFASGERFEAINAAVSAVGKAQDSGDEQILGSAKDALASSLEVYPAGSAALRSSYSVSDVADASQTKVSELGEWFCTQASDGNICIYDIKTGTKKQALQAPDGKAFSSVIAAFADTLLVQLGDSSIWQYDISTGECSDLELDGSSLSVKMSADGKASVMASVISSAQAIVSYTFEGSTDSFQISGDFSSGSFHTYMSEDGRNACINIGDKCILLNVKSGKHTKLKTAYANIASAVFGGGYVFTTSYGNNAQKTCAQAFNLQSGKCVWKFDKSWNVNSDSQDANPYITAGEFVACQQRSSNAGNILLLKTGQELSLLNAISGKVLKVYKFDSAISACSIENGSANDIACVTLFNGQRHKIRLDKSGKKLYESTYSSSDSFNERVWKVNDIAIDGINYYLAFSADDLQKIMIYRDEPVENLNGYEQVAEVDAKQAQNQMNFCELVTKEDFLQKYGISFDDLPVAYDSCRFATVLNAAGSGEANSDNPDARYIFMQDSSGVCYLVNFDTLQVLSSLQIDYGKSVQSVAISADATKLHVKYSDYETKVGAGLILMDIIDDKTLALSQTLPCAIAVSGDSSKAFFATASGGIYFTLPLYSLDELLQLATNY